MDSNPNFANNDNTIVVDTTNIIACMPDKLIHHELQVSLVAISQILKALLASSLRTEEGNTYSFVEEFNELMVEIAGAYNTTFVMVVFLNSLVMALVVAVINLDSNSVEEDLVQRSLTIPEEFILGNLRFLDPI